MAINKSASMVSKFMATPTYIMVGRDMAAPVMTMALVIRETIVKGTVAGPIFSMCLFTPSQLTSVCVEASKEGEAGLSEEERASDEKAIPKTAKTTIMNSVSLI
jgi:hypothetical protein